MDSTLQRDAFLPHRPAGMGRGLALAVLAHLLLIAALTFSVRWRASNPAGVEAELWAAVPQAAAPRAVEPEPPPRRPVARPEPRPRPAPPAPVEPPAPRVADAQIAIEQAKKAELARREQARREENARKEAATRKVEEREQARREAAERDKAREKALEKQAAKEREVAEAERKKKEQAEATRQAKALEAQREANLKRITGMAGASGDAGATGSAAQSAGPSAGYAGRIRARIKPNIVFADTLAGNPVATAEVRVAPDGSITSRRIVKSSGSTAWDEAVLRAIDRTEVLPRDTDGRVPPSFSIEFRPRD